MKLSIKFILTTIVALILSTESYCQPQEWYEIENNERSISFFGQYGSLYNRRYNRADSITYTGYFKTHYKYDNNGALEPLDDCNLQAKMSSIKTLYDVAKAIDGYNNNEDFTAVKIIYGMEGRKLVMIFQPLVLKKTSSGYNGGYFFTHTQLSPNRYRVNNDGSLSQPLTAEQYEVLVNAYKSSNSKIYIEKIESNNHKYVEGKDIAYCILSLQDIIEVYLHNRATQNPDINAKVTFSFVASIMITNDPDYKQHVVVYHRMGILDFDGVHKFSSFGADYSQLCPPQCNTDIWIYTNND